MRSTDPIAACDRLAGLLERAMLLETTAPRAPDDSVRVPVLDYAIAQLRMRVRPALEPGWIDADPVHVTLFGGTNTGKSTILNLLIGRAAAGMGVRARISQHPEAYGPVALGDRWLERFQTRFEGYRRYRGEHPPRQSDEELRHEGYRPALATLETDHLPQPEFAPAATRSAVLWDGPDFSTEEAETYLRTVLDLLGLADLVVMSVTDEAYADDRGTALLRMIGDAGVTTLVVANKLPANPSLLEDITRTLESAGSSRAPVLRLPEAPGASSAERLENLLREPDAQALREAVARQAARGPELKRVALAGSLAFLERHFDELLRPLADEAGVADDWGRAVERLSQDLILTPYRRDYLEGVRYGEFNRTLLHLMELLQVPYIGPLLDLTGRAMKTPLRLANRGVRRLLGMQAGEPRRPPEEEVLKGAIASWLAALKAEAQVLARGRKPGVWAEVVSRLDDEAFRADLAGRFDAAFADYRVHIDAEVRRRAEELYVRLKESPARLAALRGANLTVSAASVGLAIKTFGLNWSDAVLGPVVAGLWQNLLEWGMGRYLDTLRSDLMQEQLRAVRELVATHLEPPASGLLRVAVSAGELAEARDDLALITSEAGRVARGSVA